MIRKLYISAALCLIMSVMCIAQQEQLYTQFMYNKLGLNPAFAGNHENVAVSAIIRNQWVGFEGAPITQSASLNVPLANQKIGLGLNLTRNTIGISEKQTIDLIYSYRMNIADAGTLSIGLQGSARRYQIDYTDPRLNGIVDKIFDPAIDVRRFDENVINFGAGLYFNTSHFYVGISSPRLIERSINFASQLGFSQEVRHIMWMMGGAIDLNDDWVMTPQTIFRYTKNSPFDIDFNISATWRSYLTGGITYRHGGDSSSFAESIDVLFGIQVSRQFMISAAYDFTLSQIRNHSSGSFEIGLHYVIGGKRNPGDNINPRYF
ncbi:MAG: type IX secretion system membrane protein PorP/SprF [Saprospiraceae bacterium]